MNHPTGQPEIDDYEFTPPVEGEFEIIHNALRMSVIPLSTHLEIIAKLKAVPPAHPIGFDPHNVKRFLLVDHHSCWAVDASAYDKLLKLYDALQIEEKRLCTECGKLMTRSRGWMHINFSDDRKCDNRCPPSRL